VLRLFLAVDIPEGVRNDLDSSVEPLRALLPEARWAHPEGWHVTVKFLGGVRPRLVEWVEREAESAAGAAAIFRSSLTGVGAFPSARRARVLWAGLDDGAGVLASLATALDEAMEREFAKEKRVFTPHLTLARMAGPAPIPPKLLEARLPAATFAIDRLVLYRSHLGRPSARYEPLAEFPFPGRYPGVLAPEQVFE
jgi:2'-5' RNA ligase